MTDCTCVAELSCWLAPKSKSLRLGRGYHEGVTDDAYRVFLDISRRKLLEQYWAGIGHCLDLLNEDQVWWRPNATSNSIGNLLLHLNGNVRQGMVAPLRGPTVNRSRRGEFAREA